MNESFWIITPFNTIFNLVFAFFILLLAVASLLVRGKSDQTKQRVIVGACVVTLIGFFFYKYFLSLDAELNVLTEITGGFNWWGEPPIQLCNINMLLIPIAVLKKSRPLMSFCFFIGPLGALMALFMPGIGFDGYSLLLPRMLGYYGTHFMVAIEGLSIVTFGLYRPALKDLPKTILTIVLVSLSVFMVNVLLRWSGLHPQANYFFSMDTEGNPLLDIFYGWIPVPYLYQLPCIGILVIYMGLIMLSFAIADRVKARRNAAE